MNHTLSTQSPSSFHQVKMKPRRGRFLAIFIPAVLLLALFGFIQYRIASAAVADIVTYGLVINC